MTVQPGALTAAYADGGALVDRTLVDVLTPQPPVDLVAWAEKNIVFGEDEPWPGPYRFERAPFFRRIMELLSPDHPAREVVLMKSAQIGGTILGDAYLLGWLDLAPAQLMCVHPTLPQGRLWVNNKIKRHARSSASLRALLAFDNPKDAKATELLFERLDARGGVIVTGANSAASLSQHTVKAQLQDDLAKWEMNSGGDPEDQADSRSQGFEDAKIFKVSTPLIEGTCRITRAYQQGTREEYHVPCPQCGHMQTLEFENMQANIDAAGDNGGAFFSCVANGCVIEEKHRAWMIDPANGAQWIMGNPGAAKAQRYSLRMWSAYAMLMSWKRIADRYLSAKGDPAKMQTFMNDVAGQPFKLAGEAPEHEELKKRADDSDHVRGQIAPGYYLLLAGVDVQDDRVEVGVWAFGPNRRRQIVDHRVIPGKISSVETRAALDKLLKEKWPDAWGNGRSIEHMFIDAGYLREHVLDWCGGHPASLVTPIVGATEDNAPSIGTQETRRATIRGKRVKSDRVVFRVGGGLLKGFLYEDLRKVDPMERGFIALPQGFDMQYFEQLCSEKRMPTRTRAGFVAYRWVLQAGKRNEVLDCAVYAHAAAELIGWKRLSDEQWAQIAAERDQRPVTDQLDFLSVDLADTVRPAPVAAVPPPSTTEAAPDEPAAAWLDYEGDWV